MEGGWADGSPYGVVDLQCSEACGCIRTKCYEHLIGIYLHC